MAGTTSPMDGVWRTEGYGSVMAIEHGRLMSYQTTAISCLPWFSARQTGPAVPGGKVTFTTEDHQVFTLWREARPGHARAHLDGSPGDRLLRRTTALPPLCAKPTPKDPLTTFDIYWQTFAENYPFFAARGIDWQQVRDRYRPQVNARTTDARLLTILSDMIAPLNDAHTGLVAGSKVIYHVRPGTAMPSPEYDQRVKSFIQRRDLSGPLQEFARGRIGYADLPHHLGYLRISGFTGYTDANDFAANSAELARTLDAVLTPARAKGPDALRGLILDLRVNGGGDDSLGLQIAARLTGRPYTAYAKRVRNDPRDPSRFTTPQPIRVRPAHAPNYGGPVALLTGGSTFSAGETFTQALMDRTPRPTRIGENTQGVFSDILDRSLPNGWAFGLPNEEFLTRDGRTFDGAGIPPDVRTPVFTEQEFAQNRDSSFDRAVARLTRRQPGT
jgi:hypothetical protein